MKKKDLCDACGIDDVSVYLCSRCQKADDASYQKMRSRIAILERALEYCCKSHAGIELAGKIFNHDITSEEAVEFVKVFKEKCIKQAELEASDES